MLVFSMKLLQTELNSHRQTLCFQLSTHSLGVKFEKSRNWPRIGVMVAILKIGENANFQNWYAGVQCHHGFDQHVIILIHMKKIFNAIKFEKMYGSFSNFTYRFCREKLKSSSNMAEIGKKSGSWRPC